MFISKKELEDLQVKVKQINEWRYSLLNCFGCKCLIEKEFVKLVTCIVASGMKRIAYCEKCKPDYDEIVEGKKYKNETIRKEIK